MAYIDAANLRAATLAEFAAGLVLDDPPTDAQLAGAITRLSSRFDDWTGDHFEKLDAQVLLVESRGLKRLRLPYRIRAITQVETLGSDGSWSVEEASNYVVSSSLASDGASLDVSGRVDQLSVVTGKILASGTSWPSGDQTVRVTGDFGWATTPEDVKRAIALLVYDHFRPVQDSLRLVQRWNNADGADFSRAESLPSGIPEVDQIVARYRRSSSLAVA